MKLVVPENIAFRRHFQKSERRVRWRLCFCASTLYLASVPLVLICTYHWEKHPREPWKSNSSARTPSSSWLENMHPDRYITSPITLLSLLSLFPRMYSIHGTILSCSWVSTLKKEDTNKKEVKQSETTEITKMIHWNKGGRGDYIYIKWRSHRSRRDLGERKWNFDTISDFYVLQMTQVPCKHKSFSGLHS